MNFQNCHFGMSPQTTHKAQFTNRGGVLEIVIIISRLEIDQDPVEIPIYVSIYLI